MNAVYIKIQLRNKPLDLLYHDLLILVCLPAATSDPTLSLAWSPNDHNKLITGQAQKFLRVFDIRSEYSTSVTDFT